MSDHEWCRDVRRDEAVRAAEDAAAVPSIQHRDLPEVVADLRERVARLEAAEKQAASTEAMRCMTKMRREHDDARAERDAAIRERDEAREERALLLQAIGLATTAVPNMEVTADDPIGMMRRVAARVAELEAAAAVRPMGWIARHEQSPPVGKYVMCRWDVSARQGYAREVGYGVAKRGPDGMWRAPSGVEKIAPMHWMPLLPGVEGGDAWEAPLASAPAANAGGESQPPRGWLTAEERGALKRAFDLLCDDDGDQPLAGTVQQLLARSTPPKVKRPNPNVVITTADARERIDRQWIAAIRAAGGEVEG